MFFAGARGEKPEFAQLYCLFTDSTIHKYIKPQYKLQASIVPYFTLALLATLPYSLIVKLCSLKVDHTK